MTKEPNPSQDTAIRATLARYFDGLHRAETEILRTVFHPDARYVCATESPLVQLSMAEYFAIVDTRVATEDDDQAQHDEVVSIEMAGPLTAGARVHCALGPKYFTDLLTLICVDDHWQIISKVFHYEITEEIQ